MASCFSRLHLLRRGPIICHLLQRPKRPPLNGLHVNRSSNNNQGPGIKGFLGIALITLAAKEAEKEDDEEKLTECQKQIVHNIKLGILAQQVRMPSVFIRAYYTVNYTSVRAFP